MQDLTGDLIPTLQVRVTSLTAYDVAFGERPSARTLARGRWHCQIEYFRSCYRSHLRNILCSYLGLMALSQVKLHNKAPGVPNRGYSSYHQTSEKPKGQIDLVAWQSGLHADGGAAEVLQLPQDSKSLCSLWDKIRGEKQRRYRQQVRRAASWSIRFLNAHGLSAGNNQMALILDRPLHFWHQDNDVIVTDYELIAERASEIRSMATKRLEA